MPSEILISVSQMIRRCLQDDIPPPFDESENYKKIYQRIFEIQAEQCDAIYFLCSQRLYRPSYAVLRSILEAMATLIWISLKIERYSQLFEEGTRPNIRERLKRIGWEKEHDQTFSYLSGFVHIDIETAEFYRKYTLEPDKSQPFPEILPDAEYYIVGTGAHVQPLAINLMSPEEAKEKYEPYLVAKTFDIIAAGLQRLYGPEYFRKNWWNPKAGSLFMRLVEQYPEMKSQMLWSMQPRLL